MEPIKQPEQPGNHIDFFAPKVLWTIIGVLLFVVIVGAVAWYDVLKDTPKVEPINQTNPTANWKTFNSDQYGFEVKYVEAYSVDTSDSSKPFVHFGNKGEVVAAIEVPKNTFPETNFSEGMVVIALDNSIKNSADCKKYSNGAGQVLKTDKTEKVNNVTFDKAELTGAAAGNIYEEQIYRVFHGSTCYEVNLVAHTTNMGNYEPGTVAEVNRGEVWSKLMGVLKTFKFTKEENVSSSATADWKTYDGTGDLKFSIQYPSSWSVRTFNVQTGGKSVAIESNGERIGNVWISWNLRSANEVGCTAKKEQIQIKNQVISMCHYPGSSQEPESYYYFSSTSSGVRYQITASPYPGQENRNTVLKVLSTLVFTN